MTHMYADRKREQIDAAGACADVCAEHGVDSTVSWVVGRDGKRYVVTVVREGVVTE